MKSRTASRLAWSLWAVAIAFAGLAVPFLVLGRDTPPPAGAFGFRGFTILFAVAFGTVGAFLASQRPSNPIGWIFCAAGVGSGAQEFFQQYAIYALITRQGDLPAGEIAAWPSSWIWIPVTGLVTCYVSQLFPTGRPLSARWRPALYLAGIGIAAPSLGLALLPGPLENFKPVENPFGVEGLAVEYLAGPLFGLYMISILVSAASLIVRFRRSRGEERQQMKWFVSSAGLVAIILSFSFFTTVGTGPISLEWFDTVVVLSFLTIPVATGIAILRHRLYDIDLVINKAVVFGALAAFLTAVYAVVVFGIGRIVGGQAGGNLALSVAATALVAVVFQPARQRAQRMANRLIYGDRVTPYEAMSDFSHRMAGAISLDEVLPRVAQAAAGGIGAVRSHAKVLLPDGSEASASWPPSEANGSFDRVIPVKHAGQLVGEISVAKNAGDPVTPAEEKLLADLASQAGLVLRNVRLVEELRASRKRIVKAQDEERRRMERDIHDGAQQQLVSMAVKLGLAKNLLERDSAQASMILDQLKGETNEAVETLRDLARGLFPQVLNDQGLVAALESHIAKMGIDASLEAGELGRSRLDLEVEANVYFCIREALQNASKHAPGAPVLITLGIAGGQLAFTVKDEGPGFDTTKVKAGSGLQNMADRIEALGGILAIRSTLGRGTQVEGTLPV